MKSCGCPKPAIHWSSDFDARVCQNCGTVVGMEDSADLELVPNFVHLRVHTHLSLLKAICKPKDLIKKAQEYGMPAIAKTEYGNMFGTPAFIKECQDNDIKPIIGTEFSVKLDGNISRDVVFIALNNQGYRSLVKMNTIAWCERKKKDTGPFILLNDIRHEGLIALIDCNQPIYDDILAYSIGQIASRVPSYIEISDSRPAIVAVAECASEKFGMPVVATGNVLYTDADDVYVYDTALKIGKNFNLIGNNTDNYFRSKKEMGEMGFHEEWYENTAKIADLVEDYQIINKEFIVPTYKDWQRRVWQTDQSMLNVFNMN